MNKDLCVRCGEAVRQLQLVTDDTEKTLAFYKSMGFAENAAFGCRGMMLA